MFQKRRFVGVLLLASLVIVIGTHASETPGTTVTRVEPESIGLRVETTTADGDYLLNVGLPEWYGVATTIVLRDQNRNGFATENFFESGQEITVLTGENQCVITRRLTVDPAPSISFSATSAEDTATINIPDGFCGGCIVAGNRFIDLDSKECSLPRPDSSCMVCDIHPCTDDGPQVPNQVCDWGSIDDYDCWIELIERRQNTMQPHPVRYR